jgi:ribosomal protein L11 methyltransferase
MGVEQQVTVMEGSLGGGSDLGHWMGGDTSENVPKVEATERFDVIVANILARVHIALADDFSSCVASDGYPSGTPDYSRFYY